MGKERVNTIIRGKLKADGYVFKVIFLHLWLSEDYNIITRLWLVKFLQ